MVSWTSRRALCIALAVAAVACGSPSTSGPAATGGPAVTTSPTRPASEPSATPSRTRPPVAATSPTVAEIARLEAAILLAPNDPVLQRDLGFAFLKRARETADPSLYERAMAAFDAARDLDPEDALTLADSAGSS